MKLLFDANLSPRLASSVIDLFPGSTHVWNVGLGPDDETIWTFAKDNGFTIISKDSDFYRLSVLRGAPPKVAWLRIGNAGTTSIAKTIRARAKELRDFAADEAAALLMLGR